ncbi:hypothetical protein TVAG_453210 [Trichomonas vaginalis G3]|uniref:Uncharacterized protein n=1 Tax=Trichomonas vaginalis (strain ATCC PRA-98 / G3) TaxID=412133 RepID=A2ES67_TRIV3|nr:hypothetical protein TVAGG3_0612190 [Trichomonas vaginalis G3]EAY04504.1 hypothetical protein TVAG_453210 [Trichomonas vaginalis G3]KAI5503271.1 hypothetical protein TVAGG3_0612190 [Trichomonas vaginalis G3]|eukprot:XP_001316727.1 hypothetical protein [Trichomonas vaginalis G3]
MKQQPAILSSRLPKRGNHGHQKKLTPVTSDTNLPVFCFPTLDSLLSQDKGVSIDSSRKNAVKSPYELQDNQYIFNNPGLYNDRYIKTAINSPRISKSPPPRPVQNSFIPSSDSSNQISIENFNPYAFPNFTEPATLEAMKNLHVKPSDLYYKINASDEIKTIVNSTIISVKKERERILACKTSNFHVKSRNLSPPTRKPVQETFGSNNYLYGFFPCSNKVNGSLLDPDRLKGQNAGTKFSSRK